MRTHIHKMMMAALLAMVGIAHAEEQQGNRLYDEYMARKAHYEERAAAARRDFLALPGKSEWKFVVVRHNSPTTMYYDGKSHIQLSGRTAEFAEKYTVQEMGAGLMGVVDDPKHALNIAAIVYAKLEIDAGTNFAAFREDRILRTKGALGIRDQSPFAPPLRPAFSGLDRSIVQFECADQTLFPPGHFDNFASLAKTDTEKKARQQSLQSVREGKVDHIQRRLEYIEAIVRILADPNLRTENPLEYQNLRDILLNSLQAKAEEVMPHIEKLTDIQKSALDEIISAIASK